MDLSALLTSGLSALGLGSIWVIPATIVVHLLVAKYFPSLNIPSLLGTSPTPAPVVVPTTTPAPVTVPATVPASASTPGPLLGLLQGVLDLKSSGTVTPASHPLLSFLSSELAALTQPTTKS